MFVQGTLTKGKGLSTVNLLIKIACFAKKSKSEAATLNQLVQGDRLY